MWKKVLIIAIIILLSLIDIAANYANLVPYLGAYAETIQEVPNESIQILLASILAFMEGD